DGCRDGSHHCRASRTGRCARRARYRGGRHRDGIVSDCERRLTTHRTARTALEPAPRASKSEGGASLGAAFDVCRALSDGGAQRLLETECSSLYPSQAFVPLLRAATGENRVGARGTVRRPKGIHAALPPCVVA